MPDAKVRYRTKYVDIAPLSDEPVCSGTLAMIDDHVEYVRAELVVTLRERIPVYIFDLGYQDVMKWCESDVAVGCSKNGTIFTYLRVLPHEIVHALSTDAGRSWWEEGAANALVFDKFRSTPRFHGSWSVGLGRAGHLSRWLIEEFGGDTYMELYRRTPRGADQAAVEAAVRAVLGVEFDDLLSDYAATAPYVYPDHWSCYVAPETEESPWVDDYWSHEVTLDCDNHETFSTGDRDEQRITARIPLTIPRDGDYRFFADHPDAELQIQPCLTEPSLEPISNVGKWPLLVFGQFAVNRLRAGPHVLLVHLLPGESASVRLVGHPAIWEQDAP